MPMVEDVDRRNDSSGILALLVGLVFAVLAIVGVSALDVAGSLVLGLLALSALVAGLILRRGSGRSPMIDLYVAEWIFAFFARLFASQNDWRLFVVAALVANAATLASHVLVGRRRHRRLAEHSSAS
jgi:apolipoprotein N-acyltransferase